MHLAALLLLFLATHPLYANEFNTTWQSANPPAPWERRSGVSWLPYAVDSSLIYLTGGHNASTLYGYDAAEGRPINDAWIAPSTLRPTTRWVPAGAPPWGPRSGYALAHSSSAKVALMVGGATPPSNASNPMGAGVVSDVWATHWGTGQALVWQEVPTLSLLPPTHAHTLTHFLGKFWLVGGFSGTTMATANATSQVWSTPEHDGQNWTAVVPSGGIWGPRGFHATAAYQNALWVCCGFSGGGGGNLLSDLWRTIDNGGKSWEFVGGAVFGSVGRAGAVLWVSAYPVSALWLMGGQISPLYPPASAGGNGGEFSSSSSSSTRNDSVVVFSSEVWRYKADVWEMVESSPPWTPRGGFTVLPSDARPASVYNSTTAALPMVLGGLESSDGTTPPLAYPTTTPLYYALPNLLCESRDQVCTGRGYCPASQTPLDPLNCTCSPGYTGYRCGDALCSTAVCNPAHGGVCGIPIFGGERGLVGGRGGGEGGKEGFSAAAAAAAPGGWGRKKEKEENQPLGAPGACICTDAESWAGPGCNTAVCYPGCSPTHGSCGESPGKCFCALGWSGEVCEDPESEGGRWVTEHAEPLFLSTLVVGFLGVMVGVVWMNEGIVPSVLGGGGLGGGEGTGGRLRRRVKGYYERVVAAASLQQQQRKGGVEGGERQPLMATAGKGGGSTTSSSTTSASVSSRSSSPPNPGVGGGSSEVLRAAAQGASPPPRPRVRFSPRLERFQGDEEEG